MPEVAGSIPFARLGFFRYETGALSHQFEAESMVRFSILISLRVLIRVVLDSFFFRADSTLTHMTIQVTQLRLNSNQHVI